MSIKHLSEDDRPREKFLLKGKNSVSNAELLAIIMGSGNRDESAVDLARRILKSVDDNWFRLGQLTIEDFMKFKGIGEAKAISIAAALEIGKRKAQQEISEKKVISSSRDAFQILHPNLSDLQTEEFWVVFLNQGNKVLKVIKLSQGGITGSVVDVRILMKAALDCFATGIIVAHNHPSGNLKPSQEDINVTKQIAKSGELLSIKLLDHLIINQNSYYSFADEGML